MCAPKITWSLNASMFCPKCNALMVVDSEMHDGQTMSQAIMNGSLHLISDFHLECYSCGTVTIGAEIHEE